MTSSRHPEATIDQLMRRIRREVAAQREARLKTAETPVAAESRDAPPEAGGPPPLELRLTVGRAAPQPEFLPRADRRYRLTDLLIHHDSAFVTAAYRALLGREPEAEGLDYYTARLRDGASRVDILGDIRYSPEGRRMDATVEGLARAVAFEHACRWPVAGPLLRYASLLWKLPRQERAQRALENRLAQFVAQTRSGTDAALVEIEQALRMLEAHGNLLSRYAATRADEEALHVVREEARSVAAALAETRNALQAGLATKTDQSSFEALRNLVDAAQGQLQELRKLTELSLEAKAGREELTALTNHLVDLVQSRLTREDFREALKPLYASLEAQRQIVEKVRTSKADGSDLKKAREELDRALQDSVVAQQASLSALANAKADREAVAELGRTLTSHLQRSAEQTRAKFESLLQQSTEQSREKLESLLQRSTEKSRENLESLLQHNADESRDALETVRDAMETMRGRVAELTTVAGIEANHRFDELYARFEDRFRGSREEIRRRQSVYLPHVREAGAGTKKAPVVDLGCGRGEWLELLRDEGLAARGVDLNRNFLQGCRALGLEVAEQDALTFLRGLRADSAGAVTCFHLIEHLPLPTLMDLFDETLRVLAPGGVAIFETPNPENIVVGAHTFYNDLTHRNPLPPEPTRFILEARGFAETRILRLHPNAEFEEKSKLPARLRPLFAGAQDYALIGRKRRPS